MPKILSTSIYDPPYEMNQTDITEFAREVFHEDFKDIDRLLQVFSNGEIRKRHFSVPLSWHSENHTFEEKNDTYIKQATEYGKKTIEACVTNHDYLQQSIPIEEIDALFFISSTGISTPSIEARIMNTLPFKPTTKRIPIWGLGCAGGAAGLSRAYDYCLAYPKAKVLVLCVELCSLTFQVNDRSKSNVVGTSLFSDGVACALVVGDDVQQEQYTGKRAIPQLQGTNSRLLKNSEDIMGWDVKNSGLHVVFSRSIPNLILNWFEPVVSDFLSEFELTSKDIEQFIAHPGGKKVLDAYESALKLSKEKTTPSRYILENYGNMSSPTVLYVLNHVMKQGGQPDQYGLIAALGPGFSSELLLLQWK
ncbi:type III polyketide synthase [Alkalihalobacterium bogoriense]|uniref:type III polyketide synthase n=1 Tax=Alkalihalobacterium bogoriense TaxID=246272 RepID=UPI000478E327|nr:3-oxoacyl-[acyl-carrier-protein] synthase III C-terminal domain-containing protein [Alkalihalobacterium bogoriense]